MSNPLAAIRSRGWTTREELLRIGFGGPVPGIEPDPDSCPIPLAIKEMPRQSGPGGRILAGSAEIQVIPYGKERNFLSRLIVLGGSPPRLDYLEFDSSVIGHEAVHILQAHDAVLENLIAPHRQAATSGGSLHAGNGPLDEILSAGESRWETWRRNRIMASAHKDWKALPGLPGSESYYFRAVEIEARLAQVLFACARDGAWKRLPQNREEAAVILDLFRPDRTKEGRVPPSHPDFPLDRIWKDSTAQKAMYELRHDVAAKLSPAQQEAFLSRALPEFYAAFLERCGDGEARVKMGLSPGIPQGRRAAERMVYEATAAPRRFPRWTGEQWREAAARAEPETLPGLVTLAVETEHPAALAPFLEAYRQRPEFAPAALRTLPIRFGERLLPAESRALLREARRSAPTSPAPREEGRTR